MKFEKSSEEAIHSFLDLTRDLEGVERRKMFGYQVCFIAGNMFVGLFGDSFFLRLSDGDRAEFLKNADVGLLEPVLGRPMREYVVASKAMVSDRALMLKWIAKSETYARALPPKPKKKNA
jgi:TfoX/Sxy family transcriptional regulator of competence genes